MARHRLDSIHDLARRGYNARIACDGCGHVVDANAVLMMGEIGTARAKWSLERLERAMRCTSCGHRGAAIMACEINF